jgi:competence protein ComEC
VDDRVRPASPDVRKLSFAFVAGVLVTHAATDLLPPWVLVLLGLSALPPWRGRALWSAAVLGLLIASLQGQRYLDERWPASRHGEQIDVVGHVVSLPERSRATERKGDDADLHTLRFEFEPLDPAMPARIRASWYRTQTTPHGGECWKLTLRVRTPHGSSNPRAFDYEGWLYRRGIGAVATVREGTPCADERPMPVLRARQAIVDRIDAWLGAHPGRAMTVALTVGDDAGFSDADWDAFRRTGTSHLVAISGFNIAILAGLAFLLLRWTWPASMRLALWLPAQKAAMVAAALAGLGYGLLAGWESPAQRAALMLALLLLAALPDRRTDPSRVLAFALALMLAFDPAAALAPGLWLSFGAVAAIFYSTAGRLRAPGVVVVAVKLQMMLSVLLAPLTLYFFDGAAWLGPFVNLLAVPAMALLTPMVLAAVAMAELVPSLGVPALERVADALHLLQASFAWIATHAPSAWIPAAPPLAALLMSLFGALVLFAPRGWPLRWLALPCFVPLLLPPRAPVHGPFEMTVLDVGQGLAVLVRTPHHSLLYDAGPAFQDGFDAGESVVAPYILGLGQRDVDRLLLSHGDSDHAGGVAAVRRLVDVRDELGTLPSNACHEGQGWEWDGVRFDLLHPDAGTWSDNNRSCVLRVSASRFSALLAGDIERGAEARLLEAHAPALKADVLIAPHHGSKTSSTAEFVAAVSPKVVVFGAGWRSHYGHPRPEVVQRYEQAGARPLTTGVEGAVRIWTEEPGGEIRTESWRRISSRFWSAPPEP